MSNKLSCKKVNYIGMDPANKLTVIIESSLTADSS